MKVTDPGFATGRPFNTSGKPMPIPYPGAYPLIFSANVALSRTVAERSRKHPAEPSASACHGTHCMACVGAIYAPPCSRTWQFVLAG